MKRVQLTLDKETLAYLRDLVESGECASLSHAVRKIVRHHMREEEKHIGNPTEIDVDEEARPRVPSAARCPTCGGGLILRRITISELLNSKLGVRAATGRGRFDSSDVEVAATGIAFSPG